MKCKELLKKMKGKVDKVPHRQEHFSAGTKQGKTAVIGESSKTASRRDKSESRDHHVLRKSRTETPSQNLQAGESSSSEPSITNDEASPNNEWLPAHKNRTALQHMLALDSLRNLYKCMDRKCYWTENSAHSFLCHIKSGHFNKTYSDWNHCSYCPYQGDGTPRDLVQHIENKHGHCQYQCAYCFFRGMACSYVVLHQNMFHTNNLVRVLQCNDLKVSPPAESELEPLESVVQPYICSQGSCDKIFYDPKDFLLHLQQKHDRVSTLTCHICKATHLKASRLISHYKFHSLSLYQCRYCLHGTDKEEEIHQHLCNMHHNLPPLIVLRRYELSEQPAPDADVNQLKILNLDQLGDVISRPSESAVGGMMTRIQSEISAEEGTVDTNEAVDLSFTQMTESEILDILQNASFEMDENKETEVTQECAVSPISKDASLSQISSLQETNTKGQFSDSSLYRKQNAEKNDDSNDGGWDEDDDVQVLYCQLGMKVKHCTHMTCKDSCKLTISQPGKESPVKELENSMSELISETTSPNSPDSVILLTDSWPEVTAREEGELTQECSNQEAFLVSTPKKFSSQTSIQNAESGSNIDSEFERNSCAESVNTNYSADKRQTTCALKGSTLKNDSVIQGDLQKQFMASGLTREDLCGNAHSEYRCPHCSRSFKAFSSLIDHLSVHGLPRYSCALCTYCATSPTAVEKHLKHQHNVYRTGTVPVDHFINNHDTDMFIVSPKGKEKPKHNPARYMAKSIYQPEEIHILPMSEILEESIHCSECSFKTKVCSSMKQHLGLHLNRDVNPADIPPIEVANPVVHLEQNEKMFDKMTHLAASSNIGVPKLTSSVTSDNFASAVISGAIDDSGKSGKDIQDAASATTSKLTKQAAALRAKAFDRDLSEPLPSNSPGKKVHHAASNTTSQSTKQASDLWTRTPIHDLSEPLDTATAITSQLSKRAAALRARASIRDLSESMDAAVAAAITYQPKMRAAAVRAMASIRGLSEFGLAGSPTSSPKGSDTEVPGLKENHVFTSSSQQKKKPTSKEEIPCNLCGKKCISLHGLNLHIRKSHKCKAKWLCGYCHQTESTEVAIKQHCHVKHPTMPELVKCKGATSLTLDDLEEPARQTELPKLLTTEKAHHCKRKSSQSTLLKHHDENHSNTKITIAESTAHCFECYECSFIAHSLHVLRKHFEMEHSDCEFRYIVMPLKLPGDESDNVQTETNAMKLHSTSSKLCDAGHYICMLCSARTDTEEQFHCNHHNVHHPNVEPKYYFETGGREGKHMKFECQKCCFTSDNFEVLKQHLQLHITAFQIWLSAQQCDLESKVVRHTFSDVDSDFRESELENWKKLVIQGNLDVDESLCPDVPVSEKEAMLSTTCRIQNVSRGLTDSSSVSTKLLVESLSANRSEEDCSEISESDDPNIESSYSYYGHSPSPIDENRLLVLANYGGSVIRMSVSTFSILHNIYPKVKVRDLKNEKLAPV